MDTQFEREEGLHEAGKRDVDLYIRTYNTLLRSSGEISLKALVQAHYNIDSSLHPEARSPYPDMSAFIYSVLRLPASIINCNLVVLGQSEDVFINHGYPVEGWEGVTAPARRRKWFYDGKETLAVYVASVSDTDDIVPILVAFQIEWNKIYYLLNADPTTMQLLETRMDRSSPVFAEITKVLRERLHISPDDWRRLEVIWGDRLWETLKKIGRQRKSFSLRMLGGSHVGYVRATRKWWAPVENVLETLGLRDRPVYFVSSNTHSIVNLVSGAILSHEKELIDFAKSGQDPYLESEYRKLHEGTVPGNWQNFLYFVAREWMRSRGRNSRATASNTSRSAASGMSTRGTDWKLTRKSSRLPACARWRSTRAVACPAWISWQKAGPSSSTSITRWAWLPTVCYAKSWRT